MQMYYWSVYIHILMAMFWIGGMLFTAAVLVPISRDKLFESKRAALFRKAGTLFSRISWIIFLLMIMTGVMSLLGMGYSLSDLYSSTFWNSPYGGILMGKLHVFGFVLVLSGVHDFWLGPRAVALTETDPEGSLTRRFRKASSWVGRINLLLGLVLLYYATMLVRGSALN
jgi:copper resistance protein D